MEVGEGEGVDRGRLRPLPDPPSYRAAGLARPVIALGRREGGGEDAPSSNHGHIGWYGCLGRVGGGRGV